MRRLVLGLGRLALLDGGSSRRTTVMRLGPSGQPAYISLIRRRRRLIFRCALAPSGIPFRFHRPNLEPARTTRLTDHPSISAISPTCCRSGRRTSRQLAATLDLAVARFRETQCLKRALEERKMIERIGPSRIRWQLAASNIHCGTSTDRCSWPSSSLHWNIARPPRTTA
jgi:hypothetical protein